MTGPRDVVGRVASLLRTIAAAEPRGASTSDVASVVRLARPTVHRLLTTLAAEGICDRQADGRWMLGPEAYLWGVLAERRYDHTNVALPIVRRLAADTEESAFFSVRRGFETVCLIREDGSFPLRSHVLYEGVRFPLGVASAGMAVLAFMPDQEVDVFLAGASPGTPGHGHDEAQVRRRIRETRRLGYAVNPGLIVEGSWGIGAAVSDASGAPTAAVSVTGVERRFARSRRADLGRAVMRAAHELSMGIRTSSPAP